MSGLTPQQKCIFEFIRRCLAVHGQAPTLGEIGAQVGIRYHSAVSHQLEALEKKGYIRRLPAVRRGIRVLQWGQG